jgi:hypothetical protein
VKVVLPSGVQDSQCGGKAYRAQVARSLFARQRIDGFAFDAEILFLARQAGYRIDEVPVTLEQRGLSSIDSLRDSPRMLFGVLQTRFTHAIGGYRTSADRRPDDQSTNEPAIYPQR